MEFIRVVAHFSDVTCESLFINPAHIIAFEDDPNDECYICLTSKVFGHKSIKTNKDSINKIKNYFESHPNIKEIK